MSWLGRSLAVLLLFSCSVPSPVTAPESTRSDPFEAPPERVPFLFAADLISTDLDERDIAPVVNSASLDYCPALSPDGRFFFFYEPPNLFAFGPDRKATYEALIDGLRSPRNGRGDIYWVSSEVLGRGR